MVLYALASPSAVPKVVAEIVAAADTGTLPKPAAIKSKLKRAAEVAAKAKIEAEKNPEQIKKERKAKMRRDAVQKERSRLWENEKQAREAKSDGDAKAAVDFLVTVLGRERARQALDLLKWASHSNLERYFDSLGA